MFWLLKLFITLHFCHQSLSFLSTTSYRSIKRIETKSNLHPLDKYGYVDKNKQWKFFLLEWSDMDRVTDIALECFYEPKLKLDTSGMGERERAFWNRIIKFIQDWDRLEVMLGNYWGFRTRAGQRLLSPHLEMSTDSLILAAVPYSVCETARINNKTISAYDIAGIVEICLERADGKLTPCFRYPWSTRSPTRDEPYLCNLSVIPQYRRLGLGQQLCQLCEDIVSHEWEKPVIYLHVEMKNTAAQRLYIGLDYKQCNTNTLSAWDMNINKLNNILYYAKVLEKSNPTFYNPIPVSSDTQVWGAGQPVTALTTTATSTTAAASTALSSSPS